jgi:hypothetical protein
VQRAACLIAVLIVLTLSGLAAAILGDANTVLHQFDVEQFLFHAADREKLTWKLEANWKEHRRRVEEAKGDFVATVSAPPTRRAHAVDVAGVDTAAVRAAAQAKKAAASPTKKTQALTQAPALAEATKPVAPAARTEPICAGCNSCDFGPSSMWVADYEQPAACTPTITTAVACSEYGGTWCGP